MPQCCCRRHPLGCARRPSLVAILTVVVAFCGDAVRPEDRSLHVARHGETTRWPPTSSPLPGLIRERRRLTTHDKHERVISSHFGKWPIMVTPGGEISLNRNGTTCAHCILVLRTVCEQELFRRSISNIDDICSTSPGALPALQTFNFKDASHPDRYLCMARNGTLYIRVINSRSANDIDECVFYDVVVSPTEHHKPSFNVIYNYRHPEKNASCRLNETVTHAHATVATHQKCSKFYLAQKRRNSPSLTTKRKIKRPELLPKTFRFSVMPVNWTIIEAQLLPHQRHHTAHHDSQRRHGTTTRKAPPPPSHEGTTTTDAGRRPHRTRHSGRRRVTERPSGNRRDRKVGGRSTDAFLRTARMPT